MPPQAHSAACPLSLSQRRFYYKEKSDQKKRSCPPSQHRTQRPLSTYLGHTTLGVVGRTQKRSPMLPKCFVIFVPLFCPLPYEGTLMLLTPFEMLVRSPVLLILPHTLRVYAGQKCVVLLTSFAYLVQCLKRVSFFCLSFLFFLHIFPLPTYTRCRRCSNSSILMLDCLVFR